MHHLRLFAAPGQKNKLVEISQNYLVIFTKNSRYLTLNACNFLKKYFDACFLVQIVAFYQTRHLHPFSRSVYKNLRFYSSKSDVCNLLRAFYKLTSSEYYSVDSEFQEKPNFEAGDHMPPTKFSRVSRVRILNRFSIIPPRNFNMYSSIPG
jgi:hypothetical protein